MLVALVIGATGIEQLIKAFDQSKELAPSPDAETDGKALKEKFDAAKPKSKK